jgi:hypothetical protein
VTPNHRIIPTVTEALRRLVYQAATTAVPGARVTTLRPDAATGTGDKEPRVNIYLFQVRANVGWREAERANAGRRAPPGRQPTPTLDLLYLLTFLGDDARVEGQRMLGRVLESLHARPNLDRALLAQAARPARRCRAPLRLVTEAETSFEQVDRLRFAPLQQDLDELSKLWSVLSHTPYAMSVVLKGTVTLVENGRPGAVGGGR